MVDRVSGVPVLLAPSDGPKVTGGIVFRVGTADETVPTAGITHLVEHLAVAAVYTGSAHENGQTTATATVFHTTGTLDEVVTYLNGVCAALRELPLGRLEAEKQIILTEGSRREGSSPLARRRYGASGHGIAGLDEFGMFRLTGRDVLDWCRTRFTDGNAVAFLTTTELPERLDLSLPQGPRRESPEVREILAETPAHIATAENAIMVQGVTERSTAASVYARIARRTLFARLREEKGLSYTVNAANHSRDAATTVISLFADARAETVADMSGLFLGTVRELGTRDISAEELARAVADVRADLDDVTPAQLLPSQAFELVEGRQPRSAADIVAEAELVTADDVHRVARQLWDTALFDCDPAAVPVMAAAGIGPALTFASPPVSAGRTFKRTGFHAELMHFGDEGVTYRNGGDLHTVLFAETPAVLCWPDGGRALMAPDASAMIIEPTLYSGLTGKLLSHLVDERVDPARLVPMPERDSRDIPKFGGRQLARTIGLIVLLAVSIPLLVGAVVAGVTDGPATGIGLAVLGSPFWVATAWMIAAERRRRAAA